jgi:shikimate 5-dehydrogenase
MKIFPEWAKYLQLGNCQVKGLNFPIGSPAADYREALIHIKNDELSLGALVTTHKLDVIKSCRDLFDTLDSYASQLNEVSCISKNGKKLAGHAKDALTAELALQAIVPDTYWQQTGAELFCIGAGGANLALTTCLLQKDRSLIPSSIIISDKNKERLQEMQHIHNSIAKNTVVVYKKIEAAEENDAIIASLPHASFIANGTGMGKDIPGSPLSDAVMFPEKGIVWDYNYRGDLTLLKQAAAQQASKQLQAYDGWIYFIHGWTRVISEVFHITIPTQGKVFDELSAIAAQFR